MAEASDQPRKMKAMAPARSPAGTNRATALAAWGVKQATATIITRRMASRAENPVAKAEAR